MGVSGCLPDRPTANQACSGNPVRHGETSGKTEGRTSCQAPDAAIAGTGSSESNGDGDFGLDFASRFQASRERAGQLAGLQPGREEENGGREAFEIGSCYREERQR